MNCKPLPNASILWERFTFNPLTGHLYYKERLPHLGHLPLIAGSWNSSRNHLTAKVDGEAFLLHRLIWKWVHGTDPVGIVEHREDISRDNRSWMLDDSTHRNNQATRSLLTTSTPVGCSSKTYHGKWISQIKTEGNAYHLGAFDTPEQAGKAYQKALAMHLKDPAWRPTPTPRGYLYVAISPTGERSEATSLRELTEKIGKISSQTFDVHVNSSEPVSNKLGPKSKWTGWIFYKTALIEC